MRKGIITLEDNSIAQEPDAIGALPTSFEILTDTNTVENILPDVVGTAKQIGDLNEDLQHGTETADALSEIQNHIEATEADGGMSEPAARALEIAVECLMRQVGSTKTKKTFPAMEGFADSKTRLANTKLAMEGLGEFLQKIWKAIVAAVRKAIEWIRDFFVALFNGAKSLKKRAEQLEAKAKTMNGKDIPENAKINSRRLITLTMSITGDVSGSEFPRAFANHSKGMAMFINLINKVTKDGTDNLSMALKKKDFWDISRLFSEEPQKNTTQYVSDAVEPFITNKGVTDFKHANRFSKSMAFVYGNTPLGNATIYTAMLKVKPNKEPYDIADLREVGVYIERNDLESGAKDDGIFAMNLNESKETIALAKKHIDEIIKAEQTVREIIKGLTKIEYEAKAETMNSSSSTYMSKNTHQMNRQILGLATLTIGFATRSQSRIRTFDLMTTKYTLDYVAASMALIKGAAVVGESVGPFSHKNDQLALTN